MEPRPLFNRSGQELIEMFQSCNRETKVLKALRSELVHRKTPKMCDLLSKVEKELAETRDHSSEPTKAAAGARTSPAMTPLDFGISEEKGDPPTPTSSPKTAKAQPQKLATTAAGEGEGEEDSRGEPARGKVGSIRPCGVVRGVPSRWAIPDKRDFELEVAKNGTRIDKFVAALRALVKDMRLRGGGMRTITLENGEPVALDGRERGYRFPFDGDAELFEGAKVTLAIGHRTYDGRVAAVSSQWIIVSFDEDLGAAIGACVLRIDNTAMIDALADRLEKVRSGEAKLNLQLADDVLDNLEDRVQPIVVTSRPQSEQNLNRQQLEFVNRAASYAVTYLWGPPGTGKTHSLGTVIELFFNAEKRVLICSNTNQAVDQVLQKLCETMKITHPALADGRILRIGKTDGIPVEFSEYVTLDGIVRRKSVDLQRRKVQLESEILGVRSACESARRILDAFRDLAENQLERENLIYEQDALHKAFSAAVAKVQEASKSADTFDRELKDFLAAGAMRRLLMRAEVKIRSDITRVQALQAAAVIQVQERRRALETAAIGERLREVAAKHEKLVMAVRGQDKFAAQALIDSAEEKAAPALREIADINKKLEGIEKTVIAEARVMGATVTKTYLSPQQFGNFDVVIIDEASMVMLPATYYASGLAKEKVVISGDFRQLSPIVPTDQTAILEVIGHDVFHSAGITKTGDPKGKKRLVRLIEQRRMKEEICRLISSRMYDNTLITVPSSKGPTPAPPPPFNDEMTVIDTSPIQPFVNRHGSSRYNLMNALAIRNLVRHFDKTGFLHSTAGGQEDEGRLGICTPFAAQRDVLKRVVKESRVIVGTVHRYQGDEKLAMVIDVPDSLGERYVSLFAQAGSPDEAGAKLYNVAVSRAKNHVIFVANLDYLDAKLPADAFLRDLLHTASKKGRVVDVRDVLAMWPIADDLKRIGRPFFLDPETLRSGLFGQSDFEAVCGADIEQAKKSVAIYSGFVTPQRVAAYESIFRRKIAEGIKIRCVTRPPTRNGSIPRSDGRDALNGLEAMGCVVDTRWDIHEKIVIVDDEIVWFGSLNPLSHTNRTDEMMARFTGKPAALQLSAFMAVTNSINPDKAEGISVTGENPRCPDCHCRTTYCTGSHGPFWRCEDECGWTQNISKWNSSKAPTADPGDLPREGVPCPLCGAKTVLRHGPHGHFYGCSKFPSCKYTEKAGSKSKSNGQHRTTKKKSRPTA